MVKHLSTTKITLIVLLSIVLLTMGIAGSLFWPYYLKHQAIAVIEHSGGMVCTEQVGPKWFINWQKKRGNKPYLIDVIVCSLGNQTPDEQLRHIRNMSKLRSLNTTGCTISDTGLAHLKGLNNLKWINFAETPITDSGLVHLKRLSKLEILDLSKTLITDAGLVHLEGLTMLKELYLSDTKVTDKGVKSLQKILPDCEIIY